MDPLRAHRDLMLHATPRCGAAILSALAISSSPALGAQVAYVDAQGRSWRQVTETIGQSWEAVAQRCPVDGVTPCSGTLGSQDLTGWVWATDQQVAELFEEFMPGIAAAGSLSGNACVLPGLSFLGTFTPTYAGYTTFGASFYISGWSSTRPRGAAAGFVPEIAAGYQPNHGSFNLLAQAGITTANAYRGAWLFHPPACAADLDASGDVGAGDLAAVLGAWGAAGGGADIDGDGLVGAGDLAAVLGAWGACGG